MGRKRSLQYLSQTQGGSIGPNCVLMVATKTEKLWVCPAAVVSIYGCLMVDRVTAASKVLPEFM